MPGSQRSPLRLLLAGEAASGGAGYGKKGNAYHFRIESALDTIALRRETGRLIRDFRLKTVLPEDADGLYAAVGRLYRPIFDHLLGLPGADPAHIALAPADMRRAAALMTDRSLMRQRCCGR